MRKILIKIICLACCLLLPIQASAELENWERFKKRFVLDEGRVVDTGNSNISHSEGQGTGMLLAVAYDDHETFEKIWNWTNKHLGLRDDGLFVWRWDPEKVLHTDDFGSATDGDIFIAWAMSRAAKKWNNASYLEIARKLIKTIRTQLIADSYGDTLLLPGPVWPRRDGHIVINLSYWVFPAFQEFTEIDPSTEWEKLTQTGLNLMNRARFGDWELPADWFAVKSDNSFSQLDDFPFVFGYEAVRIPLYYLWAGYSDKDLLRIYHTFWSSTAKGNKLVTILGLALDSVIQQENVLAYRAVNELIECVISKKTVSILNKSFTGHEDYYSAVLFLIAQRVIEEKLPYCKVQSSDKETKTSCSDVNDPACPLSDPVHSRIENYGSLVVRIEDYIQLPPTRLRRPLARITSVVHANDNSGRLFVIDEDGKVYIIENDKLHIKTFLDMHAIRGDYFYSDNVEVGLRSMAFHPNFSAPDKPGYQRFYTVHSERAASPVPDKDIPVYGDSSGDVNHYDVISEWRIDPDNPNRALPGSQRELMRIAQPGQYNNVSHIGFNSTAGKDSEDFGVLYISIGDGGKLNTSYAQDLGNPFGKIFRIIPQSGDQQSGYMIPDDNPFTAKENSMAEIWAYGLDNPWQFSWDIKNGEMYITDASRKVIEEVNIGKPGANYGWKLRTGTFASKFSSHELNIFPLPSNDGDRNFTYPVLQYDIDEGNSIAGGFVYRGKHIPELYGHYVFADYINGRIFYVDVKDLPLTNVDMALDVSKTVKELRLFYKGAEKNMLEILNYDSRADLRLGMDENGELYISTKRDGMIRKLLPVHKNLNP